LYNITRIKLCFLTCLADQSVCYITTSCLTISDNLDDLFNILGHCIVHCYISSFESIVSSNSISHQNFGKLTFLDFAGTVKVYSSEYYYLFNNSIFSSWEIKTCLGTSSCSVIFTKSSSSLKNSIWYSCSKSAGF
jgi:hypothetical protein